MSPLAISSSLMQTDTGGGRERRLNEPSIAASGYMVIIARLVSVAGNDDEDEEGKVKTNLS